MNLIHLSIQNFRSLYRVGLTLKPLTILIGPNAGGKSNLFKALRFIYDGVAGDIKNWQAYSAQVDDLLWYGTKNGKRPNTLEFIFDFKFILASTNGNEIPKEMQYGVTLHAGNYLEVNKEWLREQLKKLDANSSYVSLGGFDRNGSTTQPDELDYPARSPRILTLRDTWIDLASALTKEHIAGWRFFEAKPEAARLPHFVPQHPEEVPPLEGDFSNLSAFLYALHHLHGDDFQAVVEALNRSIELPDSIKLEHDGGRGGKNARYGFAERSFGEERFIPPESMSDGTISLLGHLALLLADRSVTLVCLEEPDAGLHPRMMIHLADAMRQAIGRKLASEAGNIISPQVIVITHSPDFMDCFDLAEEAEYLQVYIVERNELGQTIFIPTTADEFAPWLEKYRLGEAVRRHFI